MNPPTYGQLIFNKYAKTTQLGKIRFFFFFLQQTVLAICRVSLCFQTLHWMGYEVCDIAAVFDYIK